MLVCNVSMGPRGRAIAAELEEIALADDTNTSGQVFFATLVDDPASVNATVDAFVGEIMLEAANAGDAVSVGIIYDADIIAAVTSTDTPDASIVSISATTWNPADNSAGITLSGGNLVAQTSSGSNQAVRSNNSRTSGKLYAEYAVSNVNGVPYVGIADGTATLSNLANAYSNAVVAGGASSSGAIVRNGSFIVTGIGVAGNGDKICVAVDLGNKRFWARLNGGNWNNSGTADPASNVGGVDTSSIDYSAGAFACLIHTFTPTIVTANFGATAFSFTVPSGFTGW